MQPRAPTLAVAMSSCVCLLLAVAGKELQSQHVPPRGPYLANLLKKLGYPSAVHLAAHQFVSRHCKQGSPTRGCTQRAGATRPESKTPSALESRPEALHLHINSSTLLLLLGSRRTHVWVPLRCSSSLALALGTIETTPCKWLVESSSKHKMLRPRLVCNESGRCFFLPPPFPCCCCSCCGRSRRCCCCCPWPLSAP